MSCSKLFSLLQSVIPFTEETCKIVSAEFDESPTGEAVLMSVHALSKQGVFHMHFDGIGTGVRYRELLATPIHLEPVRRSLHEQYVSEDDFHSQCSL